MSAQSNHLSRTTLNGIVGGVIGGVTLLVAVACFVIIARKTAATLRIQNSDGVSRSGKDEPVMRKS